MSGITSLLLLYNSYPECYLSFAPLCDRPTSLPFPRLRELTVFGECTDNMPASLHKFLTQQNGGIKALTVASSWENVNPPMYASLKALVPTFHVRTIHDVVEAMRYSDNISSGPRTNSGMSSTLSCSLVALPRLFSVAILTGACVQS